MDTSDETCIAKLANAGKPLSEVAPAQYRVMGSNVNCYQPFYMLIPAYKPNCQLHLLTGNIRLQLDLQPMQQHGSICSVFMHPASRTTASIPPELTPLLPQDLSLD